MEKLHAVQLWPIQLKFSLFPALPTLEVEFFASCWLGWNWVPILAGSQAVWTFPIVKRELFVGCTVYSYLILIAIDITLGVI